MSPPITPIVEPCYSPLLTTGNTPPRLLVSVRSLCEARDAVAGGCQILDIKEPRQGSLGQAPSTTISEILDWASAHVPQLAVSAALGEVTDSESMRMDVPFARLQFVKLGLSGLRSDPDWKSTWLRTRQQCEQAAGRKLPWVAVIYADDTRADSPPARAILHAAIDTECVGVLCDTYSKANGRLFDYLSTSELTSLGTEARAAGLFFALAGSLCGQDLGYLQGVPLDVLAIRGAACRNRDRVATIDPQAIRVFLRIRDELFS